VDARGVTDFHFDEAMVRKTIVKNAAASYVWPIPTKFDRLARHRVAGGTRWPD